MQLCGMNIFVPKPVYLFIFNYLGRSEKMQAVMKKMFLG